MLLPSQEGSSFRLFLLRARARAETVETRRFGHGHREFRTFGDAVGPALHDALVARVKAHGFLAVRVMVAEQRSLPAPERMPRHATGTGLGTLMPTMPT